MPQTPSVAVLLPEPACSVTNAYFANDGVLEGGVVAGQPRRVFPTHVGMNRNVSHAHRAKHTNHVENAHQRCAGVTAHGAKSLATAAGFEGK